MGNKLQQSRDKSQFSICKFNNETNFINNNQYIVIHSNKVNQNKHKDQLNFISNIVNKSKQQNELNMNYNYSHQQKQYYSKQDETNKKQKLHLSSNKKIKRIQTQSNTKQFFNNINSIQQKSFHQRIYKSLRFFKSLKFLHYYQSNFNLSFPVLILNKNYSTTLLRKQIKIQKQNHSYFSSSQNQILSQINQLSKQTQSNPGQDIIRHKYFIFHILQNIQRNITKIFQTGRHQNILKQILHLDHIIGSYPTKQHFQLLQKFINQIDKTNLQFLDMLFYQLSQQSINKCMKLRKQQQNRKNQSQKNLLPIIDIKQLVMKQRSKQNNKSQYEYFKQIGLQLYKKNKVCFYILADKNQNLYIETQDKLNQQLLQNQYWSLQHLQLYPLNLPKNFTLLQILLERYNAFAQLLQINQITVIILANQSKIYKIQNLTIKNQIKWSKLNLIVLKQSQMPCLDIQGNLVLIQNKNKQKQIFKMSTGSGDLWDLLKQDNNQLGLQYLIENKFQYIQVISTQNCLQHCFDCFMLGVIQNKKLQWGTKVVEPCKQLSQLTFKNINKQKQFTTNKYNVENLQQTLLFSNLNSNTKKNVQNMIQIPLLKIQPDDHSYLISQTLIYQDQNQNIDVLNQNQGNYAQSLMNLFKNSKYVHTFTNHSIFNIDFIKNKIKNPSWKKEVAFKKKIINNRNTSQNIIVFQKDLSDIFKSGSQQNNNKHNYNQRQSSQSLVNKNNINFMLFKYQRENQFYPLAFRQNKGVFDIEGASKALSKQYLSFLDISIEKYLNKNCNLQKNNFLKCYIDPHVSLEGQDLQQIKMEIQKRLNESLMLGSYLDQINQNSKSKRLQKFIKHNQEMDLYQKISQLGFSQQFITTSQLVSSLSQICIDLEIGNNTNSTLHQEHQELQQKINIYIN